MVFFLQEQSLQDGSYIPIWLIRTGIRRYVFVTTIPAVFAGWLLVKIRYYIMMLMALAVVLFIAALVIGIIV